MSLAFVIGVVGLVWVAGLLANWLRQAHFRRVVAREIRRYQATLPEMDDVISPARFAFTQTLPADLASPEAEH